MARKIAARAPVSAVRGKPGEGCSAVPSEKTKLRPTQCRKYMRKRIAEEFPAIVQGFLDGAKTGSCMHVKLATQLLGDPEAGRMTRKGSAMRLLEKLS